MKVRSRGRFPRASIAAVVVAALGAGAMLATDVAAAPQPSVDDQIAQLDKEYDAKIADASDTLVAVNAINAWYESQFQKIGGEAPNDPSSPQPSDSVGYTPPEGVRVPTESQPGYTFTNFWSNGVDGDGVLEVFAGSSETEGGGVLVYDVKDGLFYPTPDPTKSLTITDVDGSSVSLVDDAGNKYTFDTLKRAYS